MLIIDAETCLECAGCIGICPETALYQNLDGLKIKFDLCSLCGICIRFCPVLALTIEDGRTRTVG